MAVKALGWMLRIFGSPVYCYHEIVHNKLVVKEFEDIGVIFVDDVSKVPADAPLMLSAHGTAPDVNDTARQAGRVVVDAVCPLVTKVHHEARVRANKGFQIIYVGHHGHDEAIGTVAEAPREMTLIETTDDLHAMQIDDDRELALLAQTTLAHGEWSDILEEAKATHPGLWTPGRSDLCFATTNRQAAVNEVAPKVDLMLIIGSENSSNTQALVRTADATGCPRAVRIETERDITPELIDTVRVVGVTAGASAGEDIVQAVIKRLDADNIEYRRVLDEDEYFPLPRGLRELVRGLGTIIGLSLGHFDGNRMDAADRDQTAKDVLAALANPSGHCRGVPGLTRRTTDPRSAQ